MLLALAIMLLVLFIRTFQMLGFLLRQRPNYDLEDEDA
jgi:uncharacterized protein YneF (UPF0154 family)